MSETRMIRQGDVLLVRVNPPKDAQQVPDAQGLRVPGERTGHAHVLPAAVFERADGTRLLYLDEDATLSHEEHAPLTVPAGWWEPVTQREFAPGRAPAARWRYD
jgi:hypothetical protein